jgi:hypothetical protein
MELSQKEKQALAYVQAHAMAAQDAWLDSIECNELDELCTCAAASGVIGHAAFCPLSSAGENAAAL